MSDKIVIFDVDEVLLSFWQAMKGEYQNFIGRILSNEEADATISDYLHNPMKYRDFGCYFEKTKVLQHLPAIDGMPEVVKRLRNEAGCDLAIVSAISSLPEVLEMRKQNLKEIFGDVFNPVVCIRREQSKEAVLREVVAGYDMSFFVDDNPRNLQAVEGIVTYRVWMANKYHQFIWDAIDHSRMSVLYNSRDILDYVLAKI
ncbi:MAG: hypothetical protein IJ184_02580 [Alphaproteobacteria bacterium]|nr:hypothetical protein [Alphaproteobacteria bacterium]